MPIPTIKLFMLCVARSHLVSLNSVNNLHSKPVTDSICRRILCMMHWLVRRALPASKRIYETVQHADSFTYNICYDRLCIQFVIESSGIGTAYNRCDQLYNCPPDIWRDYAFPDQKYSKKKWTASAWRKLALRRFIIFICAYFFVCISQPKRRYWRFDTLRQRSTNHDHHCLTKWRTPASAGMGRVSHCFGRIDIFGSSGSERARPAWFHLDVNGWHRLGILFRAWTWFSESAGRFHRQFCLCCSNDSVNPPDLPEQYSAFKHWNIICNTFRCISFRSGVCDLVFSPARTHNHTGSHHPTLCAGASCLGWRTIAL